MYEQHRLDVFIFSYKISFDKALCSVCTVGNVVHVGVPTQVFADAHAQILCCIHIFQFLVMHVVIGLGWDFNLLLKCVGRVCTVQKEYSNSYKIKTEFCDSGIDEPPGKQHD